MIDGSWVSGSLVIFLSIANRSWVESKESINSFTAHTIF